MGVRAVLGVLLEQLGRRAFPTFPSAVPSCRQERSQSSRNPIMETPCTPLISKPTEATLSPNSRWLSWAGPGIRILPAASPYRAGGDISKY